MRCGKEIKMRGLPSIYLFPQLVFLNSIVQGPELQCLLKVKEDLNLVLIFQHAILDA